ncbi:MAG: glycosyltransferase family 2 protein [Calditrichaeota bacterium]|nr:glycosyltransferase family 2 protein [Calditrichota bacterium]
MSRAPEHTRQARVAIVIPHAGGTEILRACLEALESCRERTPLRLLLVDNLSPDDSVRLAAEHHPWIEVLTQTRNLGFAGGCNAGLAHACAQPGLEYAVLLNNDTVPEPGWLDALLQLADAHPGVAALQPRLLSLPNPGKLDYSGAAGGLLDRYGFPYALGRLFDHIESDGANWLEPRLLAWTSGTACLLRLQALREVGLLDESFFMHMEEIDLCWRLRLKGWKLASCPGSRVHHHSGYSLKAGSPRKVYLNHRNSLLMLVKNLTPGALLARLPLRLLLDGAACLQQLLSGRPASAWAVIHALAGFVRRLPAARAEAKRLAGLTSRGPSCVKETEFPGSIVIQFWIKGHRGADQLGWLPPLLK